MYRTSSSSSSSKAARLATVEDSVDISSDHLLVNNESSTPSTVRGDSKTRIQSEAAAGIHTLLKDVIPVSTGDSEAVVPHVRPGEVPLHTDQALITQIKTDYKAEKDVWINRFKTDKKFHQDMLLFNQKHQELVKAIDSGQVNAAAFKERGKELGTLLMRALGLTDEKALPQPTRNPATLLGRRMGLIDQQGWTEQTKAECQEAGCAYAMPSIKLNWESQTPNIVRSAINLGLSCAKEFVPDAAFELNAASSAVNLTYVAAQLGVSIVGPFSNAGAQSAAVARQAQWGPRFIPNVNSSRRIAENGAQQTLRSPARVKYELMELKRLREKLGGADRDKALEQRERVDKKLGHFGQKALGILSDQMKVLATARNAGRAVPEDLEKLFKKTSETSPGDEMANTLERLEALSKNRKKPLILSADQRKQLDRLIDDIKLWRIFDSVLNTAGYQGDDDLIHDDPSEESPSQAAKTLNKAIGERQHELAVCECYEQLNVLFWQGVGRTFRNVFNAAGAGLGLAANMRSLLGQPDPAHAPQSLEGMPEPGPQPVPMAGLPEPVPGMSGPMPLAVPQPGPQPMPQAQWVTQPGLFNDTVIEPEPQPMPVPLPSPAASEFWSNATSFMTPQSVVNATTTVVAGAAYALADTTSLILQGAYVGTVLMQPAFYHATQGTFTGWDYLNKLATQAQIIAMTGTGNLSPVDNPKAAPIPASDVVDGVHLKKIGGMVKGTMAVRFEHLKLAIDFDSKVYKQSLLAFLADASKDKTFGASAWRLRASRKDMENASQRFKLERELEREEIRTRDELRDALGRRATPPERQAFVKSLLQNAPSEGFFEVGGDGDAAPSDRSRQAAAMAALANYEKALKGEPVEQDVHDNSGSSGKGKEREISPQAQALKHLIEELIPTEDVLEVPLLHAKQKTFTYGYGDLSEAFDACTVEPRSPRPGEPVSEASLKAATAEAEARSRANREQLIDNLLATLDEHEVDNTTAGTSDQTRTDRRAAVLSILRQYEANLLTAKAAAAGDLDKLLGDSSTLSKDGKEMIVGALHCASVPRHLPRDHEGHDAAEQAMKTPAYRRARELDDMLATAKGRTERLSNVNNGHQVSQKLGQYFAYFIAGSGAPMVIKALASLAAEAVVAYNHLDYDSSEEVATWIRAAGNSVSIMGSIMAIGLGFAYQKYIRQKNEFRQRDDMAALPVMVNSSSLHIGSRDFLTRLSEDWLTRNKVTHFQTLVAQLPDTGKNKPPIPEIEFVPYTNLRSDMWTQMFAADLHLIPRAPGDAIPGQALVRMWRFMRATTGELSTLSDEQLAAALNKELRLLKQEVVEAMDRDEEREPNVPEKAERFDRSESATKPSSLAGDTVIDLKAIRIVGKDSTTESSSSDSDADSDSN